MCFTLSRRNVSRRALPRQGKTCGIQGRPRKVVLMSDNLNPTFPYQIRPGQFTKNIWKRRKHNVPVTRDKYRNGKAISFFITTLQRKLNEASVNLGINQSVIVCLLIYLHYSCPAPIARFQRCIVHLFEIIVIISKWLLSI